MSKRDVSDLAEQMGEQSFAGGTFVFRRGERAARVHVVRSGSVELSRQIQGRRVTVQVLRPGDVFGDVPMFLGDLEPFDARALEDSTILSLDADDLFELLQTRPLIARRWLVSLAERMAGLHHRLMDLMAGGIDAQLASILLREADESGQVRISQGHLADMLGVQRTSVQRVLKTLESSGLVGLGYRRISVVDADRLSALVDLDDDELAHRRDDRCQVTRH